MKRHFYVSDDLQMLASIENQLETAGITAPQVHVLSEDDAALQAHGLHQVEAVLKKDVVKGTRLGAVVGAIAAALVLAGAYYSGLTAAYTWLPAMFLAVIVLGFCTWEGGLIGIQEPHTDFRRFDDDLQAGKHVLFVDVEQEQEGVLNSVVNKHPRLQYAGEGDATPRIVVKAQDIYTRFMQTAP